MVHACTRVGFPRAGDCATRVQAVQDELRARARCDRHAEREKEKETVDSGSGARGTSESAGGAGRRAPSVQFALPLASLSQSGIMLRDYSVRSFQCVSEALKDNI